MIVLKTLLLVIIKAVSCSRTVIGLLNLPMIISQFVARTTNVHTVTLSAAIGTSVQVTKVWLVVVGQLPQLDAKILYWIVGHSGVTELQVKVICLETVSTMLA